MTTYAEARDEIANKIVAGDPGHIAPAKLKEVLDKMVDAAETATAAGEAGGYATLDGDSLVPVEQLPDAVKNVAGYADFASFPVTGVTDTIYIAYDTLYLYRWQGAIYQRLGGTAEMQTYGASLPATLVPGTTHVYPSGEVDLIVSNGSATVAVQII